MLEHTVIGGGGLKLHVSEAGNPNGRPLLFIHCATRCRLAWMRQLESDLVEDFRLVAMDLRGHGLSEKPVGVYSDARLWADDVHAVITTLGLERPILIAHGHGGLVACDYLRFYGDEQLGGLNLVTAIIKLGSDEAAALFNEDFLALVPGLLSHNVSESVHAHLALIQALVGPSEADTYFWLGFNTIVPPYVREEMFSRVVDNDDVLRGVQVPVLITHGAADTLVYPKAAQQQANLIPHAVLSLYEGVSGAPYWEDADRFNRELREFAARTELVASV
jgi:non-heme chloroperoxidase